MSGELISPGFRTPVRGLFQRPPPSTVRRHPSWTTPHWGGWAPERGPPISCFSGLETPSISFTTSGSSVATFRYTGNNFYLGQAVGWGVSNLFVGGGAQANSWLRTPHLQSTGGTEAIPRWTDTYLRINEGKNIHCRHLVRRHASYNSPYLAIGSNGGHDRLRRIYYRHLRRHENDIRD